MIGGWLKRLAGAPGARRAPLARLRVDHEGPIYAIGDVHGHVGLLKALEDEILADGKQFGGEKLIVMVGDLIDRGPRSAQVLDHCLAPLPVGWRRLSLCGNHEISMLDALTDRAVLKTWLGFGGVETLASYGIGHAQLQEALGSRRKLDMLIEANIPGEHIGFLKGLPAMIETERFIFAHAGLNPAHPVTEQSDDDLLWYQGERSDLPTEEGKVVVHGHVIVEEPVLRPGRINIDLGAYISGRLAAVRLLAGHEPEIFVHQRNGTSQRA